MTKGLLGKAYAPTFTVLFAVIADVLLGITVWHFTASAWATVLAMLFAPLAFVVAWICIAQPTTGPG